MVDPDRRLVQQAKSGNRNAFGKLVKKYQKQILYLSYDLMRNYEDARDLAQDAFTRAFEKLEQFEERSQFSTWLYRITVNLAMDRYRHRKRNQVKILDADLTRVHNRKDVKQTDIVAMPELAVEQHELRDQIAIALNKLSPNQRIATVLKYFHQKSSKEIADMMGCNENTVRIHIFRAMANLKKHLKNIEL